MPTILATLILFATLLQPAPPPSAPLPPPHWTPTLADTWQIQLLGEIDTSHDVDIYDVDLFDAPNVTLAELKDRGVRVVCYLSAGSWEDWREDAAAFPAEAIGEPLDGWPGESWLDVRHPGIRAPLADRLDLAAERGCDAVDPDNVDGYQNETGFPLTDADSLAFNRWLAAEAHARGLAVGLKNDLEQIEDLVAEFDFAINEECFDYDECELLTPFVDAGKPVLQLTYGDPATRAPEVCPPSAALGLSTLIKDLDLGPERFSCTDDWPA